jgi:hypothetical protein
MRLIRKWMVACGIIGTAVVLTGCSGINASPSVSPASFILPGLLQAPTVPDKPPVVLIDEGAAVPDRQVAHAR